MMCERRHGGFLLCRKPESRPQMNVPPSARRWRSGETLLLIAAVGALLTVAATGLRPSNLACVSNVAALDLAVRQYTQDNDEQFPPMTGAAFQTAVQPYARNPNVFVCPVTGAEYATNASLSYQSLVSLGTDLGAVVVLQDAKPHADGKFSVGYLDGRIERGGVDQTNPEQASVNDAKRLTVAVLQYEQDYDEYLPPLHTPAEMQAALLPYVGTPSVFRSPASGLPYTPNPALSGVSLLSIPDPSQVVLLRDPRRDQDGRSVVAYLNGRVVK